MTDTPPDALLFITRGCPHCPAVLQHLAELVKKGNLGRLEVINAGERPDLAKAMGVRSSPWIRIGEFELEGAHDREELELWCRRAGQPDGFVHYLAHLLEHGQLARTIDRLQQLPEELGKLAAWLGNSDTPMAVRIGISAVLEEFAASPVFASAVPPLVDMLQSESARVRLDACHLLGLSGDRELGGSIAALLQDSDGEVREVARESLETLLGNNP